MRVLAVDYRLVHALHVRMPHARTLYSCSLGHLAMRNSGPPRRREHLASETPRDPFAGERARDARLDDALRLAGAIAGNEQARHA